MNEEFEESDETEEELHLARLADATRKGEQWSREDQEWVIAQLQQAWDDLAAEKAAVDEEGADIELSDS